MISTELHTRGDTFITKRVLVIDPSPGLIVPMRQAFKELGYDVEVFWAHIGTTFQMCFNFANRFKPDVILLSHHYDSRIRYSGKDIHSALNQIFRIISTDSSTDSTYCARKFQYRFCPRYPKYKDELKRLIEEELGQ